MHNILPLLFTTWSLILLSQTSNKLTLSKITMLYIFQKGLVSTNVQHVMFTSFELFDIFPVSLYLLSLICKLLILWVSWIHLMKRIGCTSDDGSQFCVPGQFAPCSCHVQSLSSATHISDSCVAVATHVWRWLSWHHKEANIFLTRPHAPPWKFDNAGHLCCCFSGLEEGYIFCLGLFIISVRN